MRHGLEYFRRLVSDRDNLGFPDDFSQAHQTVAPSSVEQKRGRIAHHREYELDAFSNR